MTIKLGKLTLVGGALALAATMNLAQAADQVAAEKRLPEASGETGAGNGFSAATMDAIKARLEKASAIARQIRQSDPMDDINFLSLSQALMGAPAAALEAAASANTYKGAMAAVRAARNQKSLGAVDTEFVFYPIVPCRLLDTRANGIKLVANTPFGVDFDGGNPGNAAGCTFAGNVAQLGGTLGGLTRTALAINVTVTQPAAPGFIQVRPVGTTNVTSNQNFVANQDIAGYAVVQDAGTANEFELFASVATHAVVDVLGVFAPPMATALDCVMVNGADTSIPAGSGGANSLPGTCAAGYTEVAKYCRTASFAMNLAGFNGPNFNGACNWRNPTAGAIIVNTDIRCCRVPGR